MVSQCGGLATAAFDLVKFERIHHEENRRSSSNLSDFHR